jgi:predicted transcriptional regulator
LFEIASFTKTGCLGRDAFPSQRKLMNDTTDSKLDLLSLTADIVSAHVANNSVAVGDLPVLIANVHGSLAGLGTGPTPVQEEEQKPAVSVRTSVKPDYIVCLEDGKRLKMLKRHLMTHYQLTPDAYRAKWKLPADYPMVSPNYAEQRRSLAKKIGLGRKGRGTPPLPEPAPSAPKRRGRKPKATAS